MKIKREEVVYKLFDVNGNIEEESKTESIIIVPEEDMAIRNKITGEKIYGVVGLGNDDNVSNYEDVEV